MTDALKTLDENIILGCFGFYYKIFYENKTL